MVFFRRIRSHLLLLWLLPLLLTMGVDLSGLAAPLKTFSYDRLFAQHGDKPSDDLLIVAIDEQSLLEIGRWPWPRQRHAELLDRVLEAGARAVFLDVVFAEPDEMHPENDHALAETIGRHGRVVLPLLFEQLRLGGQLVETLPFPPLSETAAALGHVEAVLDRDGRARSIYLFSGVGEPFWPHAGLALLGMLAESPLHVAETRWAEPVAPQRLIREARLLIPFAGPPGSYPRVSASDVLADRIPPHYFHDRIVFVGMTANGFGDILFTPVSTGTAPMSGVEFNANVFDALRHQHGLQPMRSIWQAALGGALVLGAAAGCYWTQRRWRLTLCALAAMSSLALSILLARSGMWFSPASALLGISLVAGYVYIQRLDRLSNTDALTGLANRRRFDQFLQRECRISRRDGAPLSLLLIDVDYFKPYNDHYGHPAGDHCLRQIGGLLADFARRPRDLAARYGGEEFALILGATDTNAARLLGERLRCHIQDLALPHAAAEFTDRITVSIGIATRVVGKDVTPCDLLDLADKALYAAKRQGRNRVEYA